MTNKEKLNMLEELLEVDKDSLTEDKPLTDISQWDSMAVISIIAMLDNEFSRIITTREVKGFVTVKDIMDKME